MRSFARYIAPGSARSAGLFVLVIAVALVAGIGDRGSGEPASPQNAANVQPAAIEQNNVGVAYMNQYLFAEASGAFQRALASDPDFNLARINLGIAFFFKQDYDDAARVFEEALSRDSANPYVHYTLGLLYKNRGENESAIGHFSKALEADPQDAAGLYHLGVLKVRLRQNEEAEAALKRCLEIEPLNTSAMYNLGTLYLKTGRSEEGNSLLERFRALQQLGESGGGMGIGNQYGEMGKYALARDFSGVFRAAPVASRPPDAEAPFRDVSALSGTAQSPGGAIPAPPDEFTAADWSFEFLLTRLLPGLGGGIALSDLDGDGDIDAVVTRFHDSPATWQTLVLLNDGKGRFNDVTASSSVRNSGSQVSCAIGDYDNDGLPDLYLVGLGGNRLYRNLGRGSFEDVTGRAGVADRGFALSATFVDYDHDGDLDLYVCHYADLSTVPAGEKILFPASFPGEANRMFRNNGDGTYTDHTQALGVGGGRHRSVGMMPTDVDNDRDIDFVVVNDDAPPQVYTNERSDRFSEIAARALPGFNDPFQILTVADLNRDGQMDFLLSRRDRGPSALLMNDGSGVLRPDLRSPALLQSLAAVGRRSTGFLDYDNDGDLDVYIIGGEGTRGGELWENAGEGSYVFAGAFQGTLGARGSASADLDGDGRVDIFYVNSNGEPRVLSNQTSSGRHWIGIRLEGLRSNKMGLGAKIEVRAGAQYQKFEVQGHNGYLSQDSPVVWIGLDRATKADSISVRWPSGILQSEIQPAVDRVVIVKELDRKGTSCPLLYTWNGREFEFVTDFLGGSAYGYLVAPGRYNTPDPDEYVLIEGRQLQVKDGRYLLNLNNQLEETIMFDRTQLLVVDHPDGTEIYPDERLMPEPPFPGFKIHTVVDAKLPRAAVDDRGNDILPLISNKDRVYPTGFRSLPFKGYAETHGITLDLGDIDGAEKVLLLLDAWIDYADSSSNLAASQAGVSLIPPYLQVKDRHGLWKTVLPSMGFPAGLPKTMTVDLTGKFLSTERRVRIVTNMKIYWDRIRVDTSSERPVRITRLNPVSADLHFRGYPKYYSPDGRLPWIYDYSRIGISELWGTHRGSYTRYGDVLPLLLNRDDMYAITRHGDEVSLAFDAAEAPPLPQGWVRDYLLYADGYGKDMDMNSLFSETMGPLPFHGMSRFPYPATESYPDGEAHREYLRNYNTRNFPVPDGRAAVTGR